MNQHSPKDRLHRRAMLATLALAVFATSAATVMHRLESAPQLMDLVIPPLLALVFLAGFLVLWSRPASLSWILPTTFSIAMLGIAIPAWYYPLIAVSDSDLQLTDILPPIAPALFPVVAGIMLFLQPRRLLLTGLLAWLVVAAPILAYLVINPAELVSTRGQDLLIGLGPAVGIATLVLYLHVDINRRLSAANSELEQLKLLAEHDVETGLYNERAGRAILDRILSDHVPTGGFIMFRIDTVDDTWRPANVIIELARRCETFLRRTDIFIRWNQDTFLVILDEIDLSECVVTAEHLRQIISGSPVHGNGVITASFAVTTPRFRDTQDDVLAKLETRVREVAKQGGNRVESTA